ncbi:MAG: prevent-host-death protein [Bacteroidota bacterium]
MLVITSSEFMQNQNEYFDRVDKGEQIIVRRGSNKAYLLISVHEDDMYFTVGMVEKIKLSIQEIESGESLTLSNV